MKLVHLNRILPGQGHTSPVVVNVDHIVWVQPSEKGSTVFVAEGPEIEVDADFEKLVHWFNSEAR